MFKCNACHLVSIISCTKPPHHYLVSAELQKQPKHTMTSQRRGDRPQCNHSVISPRAPHIQINSSQWSLMCLAHISPQNLKERKKYILHKNILHKIMTQLYYYLQYNYCKPEILRNVNLTTKNKVFTRSLFNSLLNIVLTVWSFKKSIIYIFDHS